MLHSHDRVPQVLRAQTTTLPHNMCEVDQLFRFGFATNSCIGAGISNLRSVCQFCPEAIKERRGRKRIPVVIAVRYRTIYTIYIFPGLHSAFTTCSSAIPSVFRSLLSAIVAIKSWMSRNLLPLKTAYFSQKTTSSGNMVGLARSFSPAGTL